MRLRAIPTVTLIALAVAAACDGGEVTTPEERDPLAASGAAGASGAKSTGGSSGTAASGGTSGGATAASGGALATGGSLATGGTASSSGGTSGAGVGGSLASGGAQAGTGAGGSTSGGKSGSGGSSTGGQGGTMGGGGNSSTGGSATGGTPPTEHPPPIQNGQNAWVSRYWDCCKPACGWSGNLRTGSPMVSCSKEDQPLSDFDARNACENGGSAFMCWDGAPWAVSDKLALGYAAASGPNYVCGRCFQLQFTGSSHNGNGQSTQPLNGKTMIVQVINNGGVEQDQFDLLVPGGGVGLLNACDDQWGNVDLGAQYGGFMAACNGDKGCTRNRCQSVFGDKPELMAGCEWFLEWYNGADNPNVQYKQIPCPQSLTQRSGLSDPG